MSINKLFITIAGFVVSVFTGVFLVYPQYQSMDKFNQSIAKKEAEYQARSTYFGRIFELKKDIDSHADLLPRIDTALPSELSYASLINFFQVKGFESGLVIKNIVFSPASNVAPASTSAKNAPKQDSKIKSVILSVAVSGNYQNIKQFLASLDKSARLFQVNSISFSAPASSENTKNQIKSLQRDVLLQIQTYTY